MAFSLFFILNLFVSEEILFSVFKNVKADFTWNLICLVSVVLRFFSF